MRNAFLLLPALFLGACSTAGAAGMPWPAGDVVVVGDEDRARTRDGSDHPRSIGEVPRGHYPPPGECRIWYPGREPGQQPPPAKCGNLIGRVPFGAFVLYNDRGWDTRYDWRSKERRRPGTVPEAVLQIMAAVGRAR